jgi:hypothetical protein
MSLTAVVVIASMLMMAMVSGVGILLPMAYAQGQSTTKTQFGTIASIQNDKDGRPAWVTSGIWQIDWKWQLDRVDHKPKFNATFDMFMLNGSAAHMHTIKDFMISGSPTTSNGATTYNGTATVSLKKGPVTGVPISIKLMGDSAVSIWVDPSKTENHFGNTPIYGAQHRIT